MVDWMLKSKNQPWLNAQITRKFLSAEVFSGLCNKILLPLRMATGIIFIILLLCYLWVSMLPAVRPPLIKRWTGNLSLSRSFEEMGTDKST